MTQSSVSMDLTPAAVLPSQSSVARPGLDRSGPDFAAHLRQADRGDEDARPTRAVRGGAGSGGREDDQRDARTTDGSTASHSASANPASGPADGSTAGATPAAAAGVAGETGATSSPDAAAAGVTADSVAGGVAATSAAPTTATLAAPAATTAAAAMPPKSLGVATGGPTPPGATLPVGPARSASAGAGHGSAVHPATGVSAPTASTATGSGVAGRATAATGTTSTTPPTPPTQATHPTDPAAVLAGASGPAPAPTQAVPGGAGHVPVAGQTGGVPTVSGVSAAASATAAAAPAPTTTTPQSSVAGQLAASLRTLAGRADGVHVMTVRLHPDELGPVRLVARLTGNDVHLSVTTSTVAAAEAVTAAGPRLHDALAASGLTASGLNVDHDAALAGQGAAGQQLGQGTPNGSPDAGAGSRPGSTHQGRGADGSSGGRHRLDVGPAESASRHPSARTLDLHV